MVATRDLANKRIQMWLGPASALASFLYATPTELAAMIPAAPAVRWDGLDFGVQASEQIDDRTLDDDATATLRGFKQYGGSIPFLFPRVADQSSVLRDVFDLVKVKGTELAIVERIGFVDRRVAAAPGDNINIYKAMTDGFMPDMEGTGGAAYIQNMIPRGQVQSWSIVSHGTPAAVAIVGGLTASLSVGDLALRGATYLGNNIAARATWASDDQDVAVVDNRGIIEAVGTGTANITATFPGSAGLSTPCVVTVS